MVKENIPLKYTGTFTSPGIPVDENGQGSPFTNYMYGLFMAEVSVEMKSGKTTVDKMTMIADVGVINNKLVVDGQLYGGMAPGIGLALSEEFEDIQKHSTLVGAGFPYIKSIPDNIEIIHVETPRPLGPFGASGVGELPLTSPHAAVINAIHKLAACASGDFLLSRKGCSQSWKKRSRLVQLHHFGARTAGLRRGSLVTGRELSHKSGSSVRLWSSMKTGV
jgi:CO/xanthine dehydrogenase Mo-binding subunit